MVEKNSIACYVSVKTSVNISLRDSIGNYVKNRFEKTA